MSKTARKATFFIVLLLIAISYFVGQNMIETNKRMAKPTSYSEGPFGLSHFFRYRQSLPDRKTEIIRKAFLQKGMLAPGETLIISSPLRPVSSLESLMLADDVAKGGFLYLSVIDEASFNNLDSLLKILGSKRAELSKGVAPQKVPADEAAPTLILSDEFTLIPDKFFQQKELAFHDAASDNSLIRAGEKLAFYSRFSFKPQYCEASYAARCYLMEFDLGSGKVWLQLGAPLFANALLANADNRILTSRLSVLSSRVLLDEYHQFFEESSLGDFLRDTSVMLPLVGFILICLLAAAMSDPLRHLPESHADRPQAREWSKMIVGLVKSQLRSPSAQADAILLQSRVLQRTYPELEAAIQRLKKSLEKTQASNAKNFESFYIELKQMHRQARINRGAQKDDSVS
ncbi:MAG: hypothetical protein EOP07_09160 [Proteobacteria bacterium]|nr:MAG: hypothetical protein EOP07_09160 [Pseudomonadota bacterium]